MSIDAKWNGEITLQEAKKHNEIQGYKLREFAEKEMGPNEQVDYLTISHYQTVNKEEDEVGFFLNKGAIIKVKYTDEIYMLYHIDLPIVYDFGGQIIDLHNRTLGRTQKEDDRFTFYYLADMTSDFYFGENLGCEKPYICAMPIFDQMEKEEKELCKKYGKEYIKDRGYLVLVCKLITATEYCIHHDEFVSRLMHVKYGVKNI